MQSGETNKRDWENRVFAEGFDAAAMAGLSTNASAIRTPSAIRPAGTESVSMTLPAVSDAAAVSLRIGFIMSTELGLRTQYLNWRSGLTPDLGISADWIVIDYWQPGGALERMPMVPDPVKARLRAELQLRSGLERGPFDALLVAQERIFHAANAYLFRQPYFVTADVTAVQLAAFGDLYNKEPNGPAFFERRKNSERRERFKRAAALFPWSNWAAESMVSDYGADSGIIHVVPPGIDLQQWVVSDGGETRRDGPTNILFVGSDFYRKGGDLLLEWARTTKQRDWRMHLVTRDLVVPPHPDVTVYTRFQPNDEGLRKLYREAHIFALPTRGDCYSLASIEAMATGMPVILSLTGGTGDIIESGKTGFLISPGSASELSERLDYLLENPDRRAEMGVAARRDAELRFDSRNNVRKVVATMREYLGA